MDTIVTFGEIMLRLKAPHHERFFQSPALEATFGGGEANVAVSLSRFGEAARFVTALPDNLIADGAIAELRKHAVDVSAIKRTPTGRIGIYFLESGANQRASQVVYDRENSAISLAGADDFDWDAVFADATWFHLTGITPALSQASADCALRAINEAKKRKLKVSIDLNYRKKLWKYGKSAPEVMPELVKLADVIVANEEDVQKCLGIAAEADVTSGMLSDDEYKLLAAQVQKAYPNLSYVAITLRESLSADRNGWRALLAAKESFYSSRRYLIDDIVDRVGGGDSFSAGLIYGLRHYDNQKALDFAVAASCLKHSISGDFNLISKGEVETLMKGDGSGRVQR